MVRLDLETLLVINGIVVVLSGLTFVINTAMRRSDVPGRIWSVSFIGGMLAALCYGIWAVNPDAEWILIIGNAAYGLVTGAIWSGARVFNGRNHSRPRARGSGSARSCCSPWWRSSAVWLASSACAGVCVAT
ncbi:hypothetical protein [Subtercola sp. RTI3]|uniref:hypothetical protein n=1 Tax=Subtercola sp. RTI3 TaxID=3048639 RepID=UPI002B236936|nr:hypothetical protein [Subtercola sp. RTI3]MEA9986505.1 hypothetical protein [Subtercola sp. RTI3]